MSIIVAVGADLKAKLSKADTKVKRLEAALSAARQDRDELGTAYRVLVKLGHIDDEAGDAPAESTAPAANEKQSLVLELVPYGQAFAVAPKDVTAMLHAKGHTEITADYVRTTLWRFAQRDVLDSSEGLYWRPSATMSGNVEAPDAQTSEASNSLGPVTGRGDGYPPAPPEGSIPSGSTQSIGEDDFDSLMDDDVPF